ncbi:MAG: hypothetical protein IPH51_21645 [Rubrivivax sp.]|jgi:hypothetical protein|nr:hypothetical protein [Rubrivivax sp.]MBK8525700.1 hypothetical protein [Rubrivivax sp.]
MNRFQHGLLTLLGVLALAASAASITLTVLNAGLRRDVGAHQQYLQQSLQLEGLYREMVRSLAELSARSNDDALRTLLQRHGISYNLNPGSTSAPPARK